MLIINFFYKAMKKLQDELKSLGPCMCWEDHMMDKLNVDENCIRKLKGIKMNHSKINNLVNVGNSLLKVGYT